MNHGDPVAQGIREKKPYAPVAQGRREKTLRIRDILFARLKQRLC
jgi:hypothetical protein